MPGLSRESKRMIDDLAVSLVRKEDIERARKVDIAINHDGTVNGGGSSISSGFSIGDERMVRLPELQQNSSVVMQDIPGFTVPLAPGEFWTWDGVLFTGCSGTSGVNVNIYCPGIEQIEGRYFGTTTSDTAFRSFSVTGSDWWSWNYNAMVSQQGFVEFHVSLGASINLTAKMQFCVVTAAQVASILVGSYMHARRIS